MGFPFATTEHGTADQSGTLTETTMDNEPNGRRLHHWIGKDRTADIAELADTIAAVGINSPRYGT